MAAELRAVKAGSRSRAFAGLRLGALLVLLASHLGARFPSAQEPTSAPDPAEQEQEGGAEEEASPASTAPGYHGLEVAEERLAAWRASGVLESLALPASYGGRPLIAVQFGGPGETPLAERPCLLLVGGLDGVSVSGSEAVLAVLDELLAAPGDLPADVTFLALPWANPDGLARTLAGVASDGRNDRPTDDDRDGSLDEDGPDDLDGDGVVVELLAESEDGPWARQDTERFPRPAGEADAPRLRRCAEGGDDDGDGHCNEDGPGGVVLDHEFPVDWRGPWTGTASGPWPLSEPTSEALARLVRERRLACALVFQGNHGGLAHPGGLAPAAGRPPLARADDAAVWRELARSFRLATGRAEARVLPLWEARGEAWPGAAVDWIYGALGVTAVEVAPWGPEVEGHAAPSREAVPREGSFGLFAAPRSAPPDPAPPRVRPPGGDDAAWARWLDETRGGLGFVDWQPVDLGQGRTGWVGGWQPWTRRNPPADALPAALEGLPAFVLDVARGLPRLSVELLEARRDERIVFLRARLRNTGRLPTHVGGELPEDELALRLAMPEGARLIAGEEVVHLARLGGGEASAEVEWIVAAPEGSVFSLVATADTSSSARREVRL